MVMAIIARRGGAPVGQFRVEFVLDQSSGKYLAELYNPEDRQQLIVRTEATYPSQAAAVLGLVQLFKDAILQFPKRAATKKRPAKKAKKKAASGRRGGRKHN
jgi:hypothetical protein